MINHLRGGRDIFKGVLGILAVLMLTTPLVQGAVETKNLLQNGNFEKAGTPPPGWTIKTSEGTSYGMSSKALSGKEALKIFLPVAGRVSLSSNPVPVSGGKNYLLTFWYQAEGMSTKGNSYDGAGSYFSIIWQDGTGKQIRRDGVPLPYGAVADYRPATFTAQAPPEAREVRVVGNFYVTSKYKGPATVIYVDDIRLMELSRFSIPAGAKKWEYLKRQDNSGLKIVKDKDAAEGKAVLAALGRAKKYVGLTWGQYTTEQPVGEYLVTFRLKVKDNPQSKPVAEINVDSFGSLNGQIAEKTILASDFKQAGVYENFSLRFIRPEEGKLEFRVVYIGTTDLWFDKTTVTQLGTFTTDKEQSAIWLGQ